MSMRTYSTHGMAGNATAPDWPPLTAHEVARVLRHYPTLAGPSRITWRSPRPFSATARVATPGGEVIIKRQHRSVRDASELAREHAFMAHLRARDVPIPAVLMTADRVGIVTDGPWLYEVQAPAAGIDLYRERFSWEPLTDLGQARTAGRILARLHAASAGFPTAPRRTWILVSRDELLGAPDLPATLAAQFGARPALADYLAGHDWRSDLAPLLAHQQALQPRLADLARLWTHNDWHVSNLCWSDAGSAARITAVIDFGLASPTFALYDLATAIERNAIAWLHLEHGMEAAFPATARALVAGYAEVAPLSAATCALLADLLPVVHIDYALSEVEYFHGITHVTANADIAYQTFLLGHAAWFDTAPGRALHDAIANASP